MEEKRAAIKLYHDNGFEPSDIIRELKKLRIGRSLVYRTVNRLRETGSTKDRPRSGRPRRNPRQSPNKLAKALNSSRSTIRRIIIEDLGLYLYKRR